jgi:hypothetical protein
MPKLRPIVGDARNNWVIYHVGQTPARLVCFVDGAGDKQEAISRAIKQCKIPPSDRGSLVARRRD